MARPLSAFSSERQTSFTHHPPAPPVDFFQRLTPFARPSLSRQASADGVQASLPDDPLAPPYIINTIIAPQPSYGLPTPCMSPRKGGSVGAISIDTERRPFSNPPAGLSEAQLEILRYRSLNTVSTDSIDTTQALLPSPSPQSTSSRHSASFLRTLTRHPSFAALRARTRRKSKGEGVTGGEASQSTTPSKRTPSKVRAPRHGISIGSHSVRHVLRKRSSKSLKMKSAVRLQSDPAVEVPPLPDEHRHLAQKIPPTDFGPSVVDIPKDDPEDEPPAPIVPSRMPFGTPSAGQDLSTVRTSSRGGSRAPPTEVALDFGANPSPQSARVLRKADTNLMVTPSHRRAFSEDMVLLNINKALPFIPPRPRKLSVVESPPSSPLTDLTVFRGHPHPVPATISPPPRFDFQALDSLLQQDPSLASSSRSGGLSDAGLLHVPREHGLSTGSTEPSAPSEEPDDASPFEFDNLPSSADGSTASAEQGEGHETVTDDNNLFSFDLDAHSIFNSSATARADNEHPEWSFGDSSDFMPIEESLAVHDPYRCTSLSTIVEVPSQTTSCRTSIASHRPSAWASSTSPILRPRHLSGSYGPPPVSETSSLISAHHDETMALKAELAAAHDLIKALEADGNSLKHQLGVTRSDRRDLEQQLETTHGEIRQLQAQINFENSKNSTRMDDLENALHQSHAALSQNEDKVDELRMVHNGTIEEKDELARAHGELLTLFEDLTLKHQELLKIHEEQSEEHNVLMQEHQQLRDDPTKLFHAYETFKCAAMLSQTESEAFDQVHRTLSSTIDLDSASPSQMKICLLEAKIQELRSELGAEEQLRKSDNLRLEQAVHEEALNGIDKDATISGLQDALASARFETKEAEFIAEKALAELQTARDAQQGNASEVLDLEKLSKDLNQRIKELEAQLEDREEAWQDEWEEERCGRLGDREQWDDERAQWEKERCSMATEQQELSLELWNAEVKTQNLQNEVEELREQLVTSDRSRPSSAEAPQSPPLAAMLEHNMTEVALLRKTLIMTEETLTCVQADGQRRTRDHERVVERLNQELGDLGQQLDAQRAELAQALADKEKHRERAADFYSRSAKYLEEVDRLKRAEESYKAEMTALRSESAHAELDRSKLSKDADALRYDYGMIQELLESKELELELLKRQVGGRSGSRAAAPLSVPRPPKAVSHLTPSPPASRVRPKPRPTSMISLGTPTAAPRTRLISSTSLIECTPESVEPAPPLPPASAPGVPPLAPTGRHNIDSMTDVTPRQRRLTKRATSIPSLLEPASPAPSLPATTPTKTAQQYARPTVASATRTRSLRSTSSAASASSSSNGTKGHTRRPSGIPIPLFRPPSAASNVP